MIFTRAPVPGVVKTRLHTCMGPDEAARLHQRLTERTLMTACGSGLAPVELWCSPDCSHPFFTECDQKYYDVELHPQQGDDLGERMASAFESALERSQCALVIGTDCPSLTADILDEALSSLYKGLDAVLGPASDGGYVLLGMRMNEQALFHNIPWGTKEVLDITRQRMSEQNWSWHETKILWDVDRPEDYHRLMKERLLTETA